ncbi:hypothetical protein E4U60_003013 [Claviceps pazoutovae]|uniref:Uncharacterized protein n=1 Tax=Claviceps pazoutovae TaxID=1649127 RepID=A0A9P7MB47_9HYPO|nr:hypothetical protein E4U60_003013 [Claviceps pazoutovae]
MLHAKARYYISNPDPDPYYTARELFSNTSGYTTLFVRPWLFSGKRATGPATLDVREYGGAQVQADGVEGLTLRLVDRHRKAHSDWQLLADDRYPERRILCQDVNPWNQPGLAVKLPPNIFTPMLYGSSSVTMQALCGQMFRKSITGAPIFKRSSPGGSEGSSRLCKTSGGKWYRSSAVRGSVLWVLTAAYVRWWRAGTGMRSRIVLLSSVTVVLRVERRQRPAKVAWSWEASRRRSAG